MHRGAPEHSALAVVEIAVRRVGLEQRCDLVGEPLQDRRQLELPAHHRRRAQQRRALAQPLAVLVDQPAEAEREPDLDGDRFEQREVALGPRAGGVAMHR